MNSASVYVKPLQSPREARVPTPLTMLIDTAMPLICFGVGGHAIFIPGSGHYGRPWPQPLQPQGRAAQMLFLLETSPESGLHFHLYSSLFARSGIRQSFTRYQQTRVYESFGITNER